MPLNEVSFYNTNGDEVNLSNIVNQMINYYQMKLEVGETAITDFNEGSEIRNLLEAFAVGIYALLEEQHEATRIAFIQTSYGMWLDRIGELPFIDLPRVTGENAIGTVTFTLATEQESDYVIPAGTIVSNEDGFIEFTTLADATVFEGETSVNVNVECLESGIDGNLPANKITVIVSDNVVDTDLVSVNNSEAMVGGADYEDDDSYRARLLANVQADGFGTLGWYRNLCENVSGVHDVLLVDDATYTKKVLVNGYEKPTPDSVLLDVLAELTLSDNVVLGHNFTIDKPTYTTVDLDIALDVVTEQDEDDLNGALSGYFNGTAFDRLEYEGLVIGQSVRKEDVVGVFSVFPDIVEVTSVQSDGSEITVLEPDSNGVLKLGTVTFTQTEV
jgi:uncharacterized phage protein gp47/JayE